MRSEPVQKELLCKKDFTFTDAIELVQSLNSADKTTHAIYAGRAPDSAAVTISSTVNVASNTGSSTKRPCYRCGRTGHLSDYCRFKDATCHSCGKTGHIAPVCKSKPKGPSQSRKHNITVLSIIITLTISTNKLFDTPTGRNFVIEAPKVSQKFLMYMCEGKIAHGLPLIAFFWPIDCWQ